MWDLPRPGLEPVSPELAGGFLTTVPPGKPENIIFNDNMILYSMNVSKFNHSSFVKYFEYFHYYSNYKLVCDEHLTLKIIEDFFRIFSWAL